MEQRMIIDVYADVVCPWCYIGARRLELALANRPDLQVERRWRPFQLQPQMPAGGKPWATFAREKFGGEARMAAAFANVASVGAADGLTLDFSRVASAPNTVDAHRLILLAGEHGAQWPVASALFRAYFAEGRDLNNLDHLLDAAASGGLDRELARAHLLGDAGRDEVEASQRECYEIGVSSVPCYVFDSEAALLGAQPVSVLERVLDAAATGTLASLR
jgi:predicted DsbA family dithiol-disulfide isomerase